MFNYEGYKEATPNPATYTVPDEAQLRGDFSNLRDAQGRLITIYDPATGRLENGAVGARSVPGQRHSRRIASIRWRSGSSQYFLRPNQRRRPAAIRGATTSSSRRTSRYDDFNNIATKVDQNISDKTRMFFRYAYNKRTEDALHQRHHDRPGAGRPAAARAHQPHRRRRLGARPSSSSLVFNVRAGLNQYLELARSDPGLGFNPAELGLPAVARQPAAEPGVPALNFYTTVHADRYQGARAQQPQQRNDDRLQPAAELLLGEGQPQRARRPRHAA